MKGSEFLVASQTFAHFCQKGTQLRKSGWPLLKAIPALT